MLKLEIRSASKTIHTLLSGSPVLVHGAPGIGKTQLVAPQVASLLSAQLGLPCDLITFLPSHKDPIAMSGLPVPDLAAGETRVLPASPFSDLLDHNGPYMKGERLALLFVDELGQASPAQQPPLFELVQNRRVADKQLPETVHILAATNRRQDAALTQQMATPLRNRFAHVEVFASPDAWLEQYLPIAPWPRNVKTLLAGFLAYKPEHFHASEVAATDADMFAFPTPRSWDALGKTIASLGADALDADECYALALATVGRAAAVDLLSYMEVAAGLPSIDDIEAGRSTELPEGVAVKYACASMISGRMIEASEGDCTPEVAMRRDNMFAWLNRLPRDLTVQAVRTVLRAPKGAGSQYLTYAPDGSEATIVTWLVENGDLLR